jgi:hypothetical protein
LSLLPALCNMSLIFLEIVFILQVLTESCRYSAWQG